MGALHLCENYAAANGFENVDYLLERLIQKENAFNALVIIDELDDELETLLLSRFKFPVEILTLRRFKDASGKKAYQFDPFLSDLTGPPTILNNQAIKSFSDIDPSELDTIVVPAQDEGFRETLIDENRWYQIRIHSSPTVAWTLLTNYPEHENTLKPDVAPLREEICVFRIICGQIFNQASQTAQF